MLTSAITIFLDSTHNYPVKHLQWTQSARRKCNYSSTFTVQLRLRTPMHDENWGVVWMTAAVICIFRNFQQKHVWKWQIPTYHIIPTGFISSNSSSCIKEPCIPSILLCNLGWDHGKLDIEVVNVNWEDVVEELVSKRTLWFFKFYGRIFWEGQHLNT
jgi:hypothetical protein